MRAGYWNNLPLFANAIEISLSMDTVSRINKYILNIYDTTIAKRLSL